MTIDKALEKEYGKSAFFTADTLLNVEDTVIPVSPALDLILSGGIPEGSFVLLTGPPKIGKTTMCLQFAANAQKEEFGNRDVYFFNVEGRLKKLNIEGIHGLQPDKLHIVGSSTEKILYAEDYLDILVKYVESKPNSVFIFDSLSQLCSKERQANETGNRFRDNVPLMLADFTKKVSNILRINKSIFIGITHLIANQGQGHRVWLEASGQKVQYQTDVKLKVTHKTPYGDTDKPIGHIMHCVCETSALGPPLMKTESLLRYGYGLDGEYELLNICVELGIIQKGGSWLTMPDGTKVQGMEKAGAMLKNDKKLFDDLTTQFKTSLGL